MSDGMYTADCLTCLDDGYTEVDECTCAAGAAGEARHGPRCGTLPCPERCGAVALFPGEEVPF